MSDTERKMVNGRQFDLRFHDASQPDRPYWLAFVKAVGKEGHPRYEHTCDGLSEDEVREKAQKWMEHWRN